MLNSFYYTIKVETIIDDLQKWSVETPDRIAVEEKNKQITYRELDVEVRYIAGYLRTIGVKKGTCIILEAINSIDYIKTYLALQMAGAITAPVERGIKCDKLDYLISLTETDFYIYHTETVCECENKISYETLIREAKDWNVETPSITRNWDDWAEIIFTTGTTGKSKAAVHSLKNIYANTSNTVEGMSMTEKDKVLIPLPLNHSFGMRVLRAIFRVGGQVNLLNGSVFAKSIMDAVEKNNCTGLVCVAATMESMRKEVGDETIRNRLNKLRYIEFSAGAASLELREKMLELLPNTDIHNTWGSSETGGCVFVNVRKNPEAINALGKPHDSTILELWSDEKKDFVDGSGKDNIGRLAIYGDMVFSGYFNQDELYKETVKDGWMITNDLVWRDENQFLHILGRSDDMINVGGEKVSPSEIENLALTISAIDDTACVGVDDDNGMLGQIPVLFYTVNMGVNVKEKEIREMYVNKLGAMKAPRYIIKIDEIPRNYMKKKNYKLLKEEVWSKYKEMKV